jgi:hypothetical protein
MSYSTHNSLPANPRRVLAKLALAASIAAAFAAAPAVDEVAAQGPPPPPGSAGGDWNGPPPPPPGTSGGGDWNGPPPPPPGTGGGSGNPIGAPIPPAPAPSSDVVPAPPAIAADTVKPQLRIGGDGRSRRLVVRVTSSEAVQARLVLRRIAPGASKRRIVRQIALRAGANTVVLNVRRGHYRATVTAVDTAGNVGTARAAFARR